uniref:Uncharacterized protein n=1 Tax=Knipowitschia caucasica TaxID=637954 RepID=A0AAV2JXY5_KNICA
MSHGGGWLWGPVFGWFNPHLTFSPRPPISPYSGAAVNLPALSAPASLCLSDGPWQLPPSPLIPRPRLDWYSPES